MFGFINGLINKVNFLQYGVSPHIKNVTSNISTVSAKVPKIIEISLEQNKGAVTRPTINVGEDVEEGQIIGDNEDFLGCPTHTPVSGKVLEIKMKEPDNKEPKSIIIEKKEKFLVKAWEINNIDITKTNKKELLKNIRDAGIVGMGGATFPTHVKLSPKEKIDLFVINGCECEPYISADHILMVEKPSEIIKGIKIVLRILDCKKAIIGIEDNKMDAIMTLQKVIEENEENNIIIKKIKNKYPNGYEKTLIYNVSGRIVPSHGHPSNVGVVMQNVGTIYAIYEAIYKNKPLIERIVTITGDVKNPKNMLVKIGTPISNIIKECGSYIGQPKKIILGGPMMGIEQPNESSEIKKGDTCVLVLSKDRKTNESDEEQHCSRCAKCVDVCPMKLLPEAIIRAVQQQRWKEAEKLNAMDCMDCGCCDYICPSKIRLVEKIKIGKKQIIESMKNNG